MADDFAATLFTEARAHHEAARRWFCIAVATLAIFHLMIFRPYVGLTGKRAEAAAGLSRQTALKQELDAMAPELTQLAALSTGEAKRRLDDLLADLKRSFGSLNGILLELRRMGPDQAGGELGAQLFAQAAPFPPMIQTPIANAVAQTAPPTAAARTEIPPMSASIRRAVAAGDYHGAVLQAVKPYVDEQIITPKFLRFNEGWRQEVVPQVATAGGALLQRIKADKERYPAEAASWSSADQAVSGVVEAVGKFKIEPPQDSYWWAAEERKDATMTDFLRTLGDSPLERAPALSELAQKTDAAIADNKKKQAEIDGLMARLDEEFHEQQKGLAELAAPLKGISIDLGSVVPYFPAILAIGLVALTAWLAARLRELGETVAMVARGDPVSTAPDWLRRRIAASPWHGKAAILARSLVFLAWIALASWELVAVALAGRTQALLLILAAAIGLAAAARYERRVVRSLRGA